VRDFAADISEAEAALLRHQITPIVLIDLHAKAIPFHGRESRLLFVAFAAKLAAPSCSKNRAIFEKCFAP